MTATHHPGTAASRTWRLHALLLIGSGIVAAAQSGKAIITVPMIRADLALGLDLAGLVVAIFATMGAAMGIGAGAVVGRIGARRSLTGGMAAVAIGNVIGAGASDEIVLLAARIIERVGFFGVVLAIPSVLAGLVPRHARDFAFFAYSCQIFSLTFALPLLLTSVHHVSLGTAGLMSALVLGVSTVGHVSSGFLLRAGVPVWGNIAAAFGLFAVSGFVIYDGALPAQGVALIAALALGVGGLAPRCSDSQPHPCFAASSSSTSDEACAWSCPSPP